MSSSRVERRAAALRLAEESHPAVVPAELLGLLVDLGMYEFPRFRQVVLVDIFFDLRPSSRPHVVREVVVPGGFYRRFSRVAAYFSFGCVQEDQAAALPEVAHGPQTGLPARGALLRVAGEAVQEQDGADGGAVLRFYNNSSAQSHFSGGFRRRDRRIR